MRRVSTWTLVCTLLLSSTISSPPSYSQQLPSPSATTVQAVAIFTRVVSALEGTASLSDITLYGTGRRIAGSEDETGTAILRAVSAGLSRIDLTLASGRQSEVRDVSNFPPTGAWMGPDGILHRTPYHNVLTDSSWFFPVFGIARSLSTSGFMLSYVGIETRSGQSVHHISVSEYRKLPDDASAALYGHLTQTEYYLDTNTLLPVALAYNSHPDGNTAVDIPVEIQFSDYRAVNGSQIPFRVQHYLGNVLFLDFQFQTASINTGITPATFTL